MTYPPPGGQPPHGQHPPQQPYGQPHTRPMPHRQPPSGYDQSRPPHPPQQPPPGYPYGYGHQPPPPPPRSNTGLIVAIVAGITLVLVAGVITTLTLLSSTSTPTADDRLRAFPDDPPSVFEAQPDTSDSPATQEPAETQAAQVAEVGETVTVNGFQSGVQVAVTVNRVVDNATPTNEFLKPKDGNRYVAVELTLNNTGTVVYTDSPLIGGVLIDAEGQQHQPTFAEVKEGTSFGGAVNIAQGDSRKGVIVFEVPSAAKLAKLQFGPAIGQQKGEWALS
ncbi:hypothetical protein GCM10010156_32160 [Planobispora rosea]|uniref:DUF4352 domain-containing protein n=1 Tax=Planobispora rosea TaxID=35762 RepID=A0A8J3WCY2_PLARO|nr:DUF4352 domain-containing protein [Planobispora rosea]GGS70893.1 hypothetical protein GCM10010156_32160 [Planobispora rosea]GIH85399.1 hypothetical protein Pro02_38070 [Planobispora rosea]